MRGLLSTVLNTPYWFSFFAISSYQLFLYGTLQSGVRGFNPWRKFLKFWSVFVQFRVSFVYFSFGILGGFAPVLKKKCGGRATAPAPPPTSGATAQVITWVSNHS